MKQLVIRDCESPEVIKCEIIKVMSSEDSFANNIKEDVMKRFYDIESNGHKPMQIERGILDRLVNTYGRNGYIIVSAYGCPEDEDRYVQITRKLYSEIKHSGYIFLPTYRGYRSQDSRECDFAPSFLVFNQSKMGQEKDFGRLYELGLKWCVEHADYYRISESTDGNLSEIYITPAPCTLNERMRRGNEIFLY